MKRIPCPMCDKTFKNQSGLSWHYIHIHSEAISEVIAVSDDLSERTVAIVQDQAPEESEDTVTQPGDLDTEEQVSLNDVKLMLDKLETTVHNLQNQVTQSQSRFDGYEQRLREIAEKQTNFALLEGRIKELAAEMVSQRTHLDSVRRLVWTLDVDHRKQPITRDFFTKKPTQDEIAQARHNLRTFLGKDPIFFGG